MSQTTIEEEHADDGTKPDVASTRAPAAARQGGPGGPHGMAVEKPLNFWPSAKRLMGTLAPERLSLVWVFLLTVVSVVCTVIGPKLLGEGTTLIFEGAIS